MLNPVPRWFAGATFLFLAFVAVMAYSEGKAQEPTVKEAIVAPGSNKCYAVFNGRDVVIYLPPSTEYKDLGSPTLKEKAKIEVNKDGSLTIRGRIPRYRQGATKDVIELQLIGVKEKMIEIGLPKGWTGSFDDPPPLPKAEPKKDKGKEAPKKEK